MASNVSDIASTFDARAANYSRNDWHRRCAERLVELCRLRRGAHVLDAGTGTGFAALAAARRVGDDGRVVGVDVSAGMLREARAAASAGALSNVEFQEADATRLSDFAADSFDAVTCAAALLYMPVAEALRAWRRVLKPGGLIAFSSMQAGSPPAGRIFRECAAAYGLALADPSAPLGTSAACRSILEAHGFDVADIVSETIDFSTQDLTLAWESNLRSAAHEPVQTLSAADRAALQRDYLDALARALRDDPAALARAGILYAIGGRPSPGTT